MALCPKQLQHRDTRSQEGTGEPVAGFLFVDAVSQSSFEQQVSQLMRQREPLPITGPALGNRHDRILPAIFGPCLGRQAREAWVFFVDHDDQQAKAFEGVGEVSNRIQPQLPSVADRIRERIDLIQRGDVLGQIRGRRKSRERQFRKCAEQLHALLHQLDDLDLQRILRRLAKGRELAELGLQQFNGMRAKEVFGPDAAGAGQLE